MKRTLVGIVAAGITVALASCGSDVPEPPGEQPSVEPSDQPGADTPESVADDVRGEFPTTPDFWGLNEWGDDRLSPEGWLVEPVAGWLTEGQSFAIVTWGSSSCPWVATEIKPDGDDAVSVHFTLPAADACTDDLGPLTHVFSLPESVTERPVTLTVTGEDLAGWITSDPEMPALTFTLDTPESVATNVLRELPDTADFLDVDVAEAWDPIAGWIEEGETFAVVLWGSSSCVPIPISIEADGDDRIAIEFIPGSYEDCTADLAPRVFEFALPDGVTERPVTLSVTQQWADDSETSDLTLR